jgi:hypothetical protein
LASSWASRARGRVSKPANKRQNKVTYYKECIDAIHAQGIAVMAGFIAGFDGDTLQHR